MEVNIKQMPVFNFSSSFKMSPDSILDLANATYLEMKEMSKWSKNLVVPARYPAPGGLLAPSPTICGRCSKYHTGQCTQPHWKLISPSAGKSEETVKNGKPYYWCSVCER